MKPSNISVAWSRMDYRNSEMKLDQFVGYLNEEKINLSPVFQRGRVWGIGFRKKLIKNIVLRRPIPAIFLYKEEAGTRYSYNILDGKQRLESLLLFIGNQRQDFKVNTWGKYIFGPLHRQEMGFAVDIGDGQPAKTFADLDEKTIRDLREYSIPTIEITLSESTSLDEMISLFVDINQQGVKVTRFDIVKAMKQKDPLLKDVFKLLAIKQRRQQDVLLRSKKRAPFVYVLKRLQMVASVADPNAQVDRMWERLFELALFVRSGKHRKPTEILKTFIKAPSSGEAKLSSEERAKLASVFGFLQKAYKSELSKTRLATDQTHFYIMVTALLDSDLMTRMESEELTTRLLKFGQILDEVLAMPSGRSLLGKAIRSYQDISAKQTTDVSRREDRQQKFIEAIDLLCE